MVKTYNEFEVNENWRKIKYFLRIPGAILDVLLSKVLNYVPILNLKYDELCAKFDSNRSIPHLSEIEEDIKKISLSDIKSTKMKMSLIKSGLLKSWNIYYVKTFGESKGTSYNNNRDFIYLSKDELKKGDHVMKDRFNDHFFFDKDNIDKYGKDLPEVFVLVTHPTIEHDELKHDRKSSRLKKEHYKYSKLLDGAIKDSNLPRSWRTSDKPSMFSTYHEYGKTEFLLHGLIKRGYIDLVQKYLNNCDSDEDRIKLVNMFISDGKETKHRDYDTKMSFDLTKSDEMRSILVKWLSKKSKVEYMKKNKMDLTMKALRKINDDDIK